MGVRPTLCVAPEDGPGKPGVKLAGCTEGTEKMAGELVWRDEDSSGGDVRSSNRADALLSPLTGRAAVSKILKLRASRLCVGVLPPPLLGVYTAYVLVLGSKLT
jgi:hypothetical protein